MITYIISFILCSGLLLLAYHVMLSNERMYRFNRFYLLLSLMFSLLAPLVSFNLPYLTPIIPDVAPAIENMAIGKATDNVLVAQATPNVVQPVQSYNYLPNAIVIVYALMVLVLFVRFLRNIINIKRAIARSNRVIHKNASLLILNDNIDPHTFLTNIFISKRDYDDGIETLVIRHEQAHADQLHSIDIMIVELLQVVCWINPLIPFYRRAMQLNHEFLADEAVLENYEDMPDYQRLLLIRTTQTINPYITSQFNYLTIKKRLIMMTKSTSGKTALYKKLVLIPVVAATMVLSCNNINKDQNKPQLTDVILTTPKGSSKFPEIDLRVKYSATAAPKSVMEEYAALLKKYDLTLYVQSDLKEPIEADKAKSVTPAVIQDRELKLKNISPVDRARMNALFTQMSKIQQNSQYVLFIKAPQPVGKNSVTENQLAQWQDSKTYRVKLDGKRVDNKLLANYKPNEFDFMAVNTMGPGVRKKYHFNFLVTLMTKPFYADYYKKKMDDQSDRMISFVPMGKTRWITGL